MGWSRGIHQLVAVPVAALLLISSLIGSANLAGAQQVRFAASRAVPPSDPCNPLSSLAVPGGGQCMLPFPSDAYTVADRTTPTGRRVSIPTGAFASVPVSGSTGTATSSAFNPAPWDRNDGFSPGSNILVHVPGIDLARSGVATISDIGNSLLANSPVVLLDATSGRRWPTWSELDVNDPDPSSQLLIIHPAQNLAEGHRYLVALRDLKTSSGTLIPPEEPFGAVVLPRGPAESVPPAYAAHVRSVVARLAAAGISSKGMFIAWDFTVASTQNLSEPALTMRDQTFAALGRGVGPYLVTKVVNDPPGQPDLARVVTGYFDVPSYLSGAGGATTSVLTDGANGLPQHLAGHIDEANFECEIPKAASAAHPAAIGVYGHGLFGSAVEVTQSAVPGFSNRDDYVFCGTDWLGLSQSTLGLGASVVTNLNNFPPLVDNLMQALLNAQVLGNLLDNPKGFAQNGAFEDGAHHPLIKARNLVYYGNSEGGIMGGAFAALSTEVHRAVLGVPGMDYAVLLTRSSDFAPFQAVENTTYPDRATQQVGADLLQMLWDRADADGYAEQMTGGLPGTPPHQVLLEEAFGDHQVANIVTETEARTIGARIHEPALARGRSLETQPFWNLAPLPSGSGGPALFVWDTGVPAAPLTNTAPTAGPDPHDTTPRTFPAFWHQMSAFFSTGTVINPCGSSPCTGPSPPPGS